MVCEDMISALPEDLLVRILSLVPTRDAAATMFLSKRWLSIWTMIHSLEYKDDDVDDDYVCGDDDSSDDDDDYYYDDDSSDDEDDEDENENKNEDLGDEEGEDESIKSVWFFLNKSLQLNKAHVIDTLSMELGLRCPTNADVGKWVAHAVSRCVRELTFKLCWSADPTLLPHCLYSCPSLVELTLSHKILLDVPPSASLPSLKSLHLLCVVYKDDDSLASFLSNCPVLEILQVRRSRPMDDNVTTFNVRVPSLLRLVYVSCYNALRDTGGSGRCLVTDTPALSFLNVHDLSGGSCFFMGMPCLDSAFIALATRLNDKSLASLSSVSSLTLTLNDETVVCCTSAKFSCLTTCRICPAKLDWIEPIILLLQNSPKMNHLLIDCEYIQQPDDLPLTWNQPSSVPQCLASQLESLEWEGYGSRREEEKLLAYVLANSYFLKTVTISLSSTIEPGWDEPIRKMLEEIPRVSTESQLIFSADT